MGWWTGWKKRGRKKKARWMLTFPLCFLVHRDVEKLFVAPTLVNTDHDGPTCHILDCILLSQESKPILLPPNYPCWVFIYLVIAKREQFKTPPVQVLSPRSFHALAPGSFYDATFYLDNYLSCPWSHSSLRKKRKRKKRNSPKTYYSP